MSEWEFPTAFSSWNEAELNAVARVIKSDRFTMGPETEALEAEYARYHARKYAIAVNSGSSANEIAVEALFHVEQNPLRRGDRAIVPAIAWATTYSPLARAGLDLVVADCNATWCAEHLEEQFYRNPIRLVVVCSILGNPAYMGKWLGEAERLGAYFLNDDCESLGARVADCTTAQFGLMATSSFFYSHQLSAVEYGVITTDDAELNRLCRLLRNHGNAGFLKKSPSFDESYEFVLFGRNTRPVEMHSAIAREQLRKLPGFIAARRDNYQYFAHLTERLPITLPKPNGEMSPFGFAFECMDGSTRAKLVTALRAESIDCRPPCGGSFLCHPFGAPWRSQRTTRADLVHSRGLFLGLAPWPIPHLIEKAVAVMKRVL